MIACRSSSVLPTCSACRSPNSAAMTKRPIPTSVRGVRHDPTRADRPPHDRGSTGNRHSQRASAADGDLAATVAKYRRMPDIRVIARSKFRPEAKSLSRGESATLLEDQFIVPPDIRGRSALIVDDVFTSGGSMMAVARAAHEAGAREIFGICPTRTMKR